MGKCWPCGVAEGTARSVTLWWTSWGSLHLCPDCRGGLASGSELAGYLVSQVRLSAELPLLEHFTQLVQAAVVEVEDFVLALSAGNHQLAAGAGLVTEVVVGGNEYANVGFYFQIKSESATMEPAMEGGDRLTPSTHFVVEDNIAPSWGVLGSLSQGCPELPSPHHYYLPVPSCPGAGH